jgi:hypothetical protein
MLGDMTISHQLGSLPDRPRVIAARNHFDRTRKAALMRNEGREILPLNATMILLVNSSR